MSLCLSGVLFFLMVSLPSGHGMIGNRGVELRPCKALGGLCFFGCKPGWTFVAFCHNILACCTKNKVFIPAQGKEI
ncbi:beta-defensin 136 [Octodon degus]|uniref:Beta-defensin 136 n=1 Tax=Octodon degus TaxID=10160 RepID=A0A6P3ES48_OCTDE|nr:beta-defensin 136 [Octodon degus]